MSTTAPAAKQPEWLKPAPVAEPTLHLFNSLTRQKDAFVPIKPDEVSWYSCGPTVYDTAHMGHARNYVTIDINRRILQDYFGYNIRFVQNVTDIDDKIIVAARQNFLFDRFVKAHPDPAHDPAVKATVEAAWADYALKLSDKLTVANFQEWLDAVDAAAETQKKPKFPMFSKALKDARQALLAGGDAYYALVKTVLMGYLDAKEGASVTDNSIFRSLPAYWELQFDKDMRALNVLPPTVTTRVSEYVPEIVKFVETIVNNGTAYKTADGSVYFDTQSFEKNHFYAKLQPWNKGNSELIDEGEGSLSLTGGKRSSSDFALWKASKPGEPSWESPWGMGRPGWHIECSVMASETLGSHMDIHSGGIDLAFPHHDNELAQSEAYHQCPQWVNYFLHTGHLHIDGQKMSKSLKNFISIREALQSYTPRQLRLAFALQQWNQQLDFKSNLSEPKSVESTLTKFFTNVNGLLREDAAKVEAGEIVSKKFGPLELALLDALSETQASVHKAFCDNLSTPQAISKLLELVQKSNVYIQESSTKHELRVEILRDVAEYITKILRILGFEMDTAIGWRISTESSSGSNSFSTKVINVLSEFRDTVRAYGIAKEPHQKFLALTDKIRDFDLLDLGISLDDRVGKSALVKILDDTQKKDLIEQRDAKLKGDAEKAARKAAAAEAEAKKQKELEEKAKINPADMFKTSEYKEWDEQGIPTVDSQGEPISKSSKKKLLKLYDAQKKLHEKYLKQ